MHDLDRVSMQREGEFEGEHFEFEGEGEGEYRGAGGVQPRGEAEGAVAGQELPLHEGEVMELASELLGLTNEQELEGYLAHVVDRALDATKSAIDPATGHAVVGALKPLAKTAIPAAQSQGPAGPATNGAAAHPGPGDEAGRALGLELEGLSHEDREFEVAKQFVKLAVTTALNAAGHHHGPPHARARAALTQAARQLAPGLVARIEVSTRPASAGFAFGDASAHVRGQSGRWFRRGNTIVLVGV